MKKLIYLQFVILIAVACENKEQEQSVSKVIEKGNLSEIRNKKSELVNKQNEIKADIEKLNLAIDSLDTNKSRSLVTVQEVKDTLFKHFVEVQGDVETDQNIIIYPEYSGILSKVFVKEGQRVSKGQTLAKIDDGGLSSQLAQAEAQLSLAKTSFERQKRLWDQKIGSEMQFLEAKTNYEARENAVKQLRSQLAKTTVKAPFSGVIDEVISDQGQVVSPGQNQLFRLVNLNNMYVTAQVPESYLGKINKGTEVLVDLSSIGQEFNGKIEQVSNFINPNNRSFQVKVAVPNPEGKVKPNLIATIKLNDYSAKNAILIPQNILQENAQGESIAYVVKKETDSTGTAQKTIIKTGLSYNNKLEVLEGLHTGQAIIVEGARSIREGQEVKIKK